MTTFRSIVGMVAIGILCAVATASADAIQKWRTPSGGLHFGDRPPAGSTLLETIPDSPRVDGAAPGSDPSELARAAADGRDIMRRREAARIERARLDAEAESEIRALEIEALQDDYDPPFWIISTPPCVPGVNCIDDERRRRGDRDEWRPHRNGWRGDGWRGAGWRGAAADRRFAPRFYLPQPRPLPRERWSQSGALFSPRR